MINTVIALVYFLLSVANDDLNVQWHVARRKKWALRGANISLAMGIIAWFPFVLLVTSNNWQIIVADLAGNWVGSFFGIRRHHEDEYDSEE